MLAVTDLLRRQDPAAPALYYAGRAMTYGELERMSARVAGGLSELGIGPGGRVAMWLPNTPAYLALYLACCRLGAIAVAVNTRFRSLEVADIVGRSGATVLAMWPGFRNIDFPGLLAEVDPAALARLRAVVTYDEGEDQPALPAALDKIQRLSFGELAGAAPRDAVDGDRDSPCNIFTTSGTTKAPKFVLHEQHSIADHAIEVVDGFGYHEGAMLQALPFCGVFGFTQAAAALAGGRPMLLQSAFDPGAAIKLIAEHDVRHLNATDDMLRALIDAGSLGNIRAVGSAAFNAGFNKLVADCDAKGINVIGLYGMSEVQALYSRQPDSLPLADRVQGGGFPVSSLAGVRVRDPDTGALLPHDQPGELELKGPSQMAGYDGNPEATAEAITADGFVRTGDLGHTCADGRFVYLQRMGDVLRLGGFLVSPVEIEAHIEQRPEVGHAQVVAVDATAGRRAFAFVVPATGAQVSEAEIIAHCQAGLAKFKAPVGVAVLDEFPTAKSANGTKIQRGRLREMADEAMRQRSSA
ncbi:MAG: AMP-binding protein [Alphaproteobacteria bacterium]